MNGNPWKPAQAVAGTRARARAGAGAGVLFSEPNPELVVEPEADSELRAGGCNAPVVYVGAVLGIGSDWLICGKNAKTNECSSWFNPRGGHLGCHMRIWSDLLFVWHSKNLWF